MTILVRSMVLTCVIGWLALGAGAGVAGAAGAGRGMCSGGVATGTYQGLLVTGYCAVPSGSTLNVQGNLVVAPDGYFDALTMSTVNVSGNILVDRGATLALGCTFASPPPCTGNTNDTVGGNIIATHAFTMYLDGDTINGNVISIGGGPGPTFNPFVNLAIKDNVIGGNVLVNGWQGAWAGFIRNVTYGSVMWMNVVTVDPDSNEIVTNWIAGNLACRGNMPAAQIGDSGGSPNVVLGQAVGECASLTTG
ncbi:MAG TPA: hypothetical protein VFB58_06060 [Chloroflexota bacterium]|nr:hypothetical protein [Chloroflexota bacterium]